MSTRLFILLFAFVLLNACREEVAVADDDLFHIWEAKSFVSVESVAYEKVEDNPILLTFNRDGTYGLKLDINSCSGTFKADTGHRIEISVPGCTEACCDSPFSNKLASMLPRVTSYMIEEDTLKLNVEGWGWIELAVVQ